MTERVPRFRLRLISDELDESVWSELATHEGLTPKDGYVEWLINDYGELGNEVYDFLGPEGTLILSWEENSEDDYPPGDLWLQVQQIVDDLLGDWSNAVFEITYVTDDRELRICFKAVLE